MTENFVRILNAPRPPINHLSTHLCPLFGYIVESVHFRSKAMQTSFHLHSPFAFVRCSKRLQFVGPLRIITKVRETSDVNKYYKSPFGTESPEEQTTSNDVYFDSYSNFSKSSKVSQKESERRRKIGLANKGRVPWNKGIKHDAETRARIKQRTIEALKDPKVRKKMSENSRAQSDEVKSKISYALRRLWGKRLNFARLREKLFLSWATSIAIAAKKGGSNQNELDWNSYDTIIKEVAHQRLQRVADKAKAIEMAKLRKERAAVEKAAKMAKLDHMKNEREQKAKIVGALKRKTGRKSREEKEDLETAQELKLKERLTKILKTKSIIIGKQGKKVNSKILDWETLDLEFIKGEKMRREVSLEDQIRAAKSKKEAAAILEPSCFEQHYT